MNLNIHTNSSARIIQEQFTGCFQYLRIEFVGSFHTNGAAGVITLDKKRTVHEITMDFKIMFGLRTRIYRRSGNVWVATSLTEDWTLERQNNEGEQISGHFQ